MSGLRPFSTYSRSSGGTEGRALVRPPVPSGLVAEAVVWRVWSEWERVFLCVPVVSQPK
jgi:hypothetical protein